MSEDTNQATEHTPMRHSLASRMANARRLTALAAGVEPDNAATAPSAPPSAPTPAPWHVEGFCVGSDAYGRLAGSSRGLVAIVGQDLRMEPAEWEANAALIASAPALIAERDRLKRDVEMLTEALDEIACHEFTRYERAQGGIYEGQYGVGVVDGHRACAALAKAALAKTGAAP